MAEILTYSNDIDRAINDTLILTDDKTLTDANSGEVIFLNAAAGGTVTLPALKAGLNFKILVGATAPTTGWIIDSAEGDNISGVLTVNGALIGAVAEDQINFIASTALSGDYIDLECDGLGWYVRGTGSAAGSITATDPS